MSTIISWRQKIEKIHSKAIYIHTVPHHNKHTCTRACLCSNHHYSPPPTQYSPDFNSDRRVRLENESGNAPTTETLRLPSPPIHRLHRLRRPPRLHRRFWWAPSYNPLPPVRHQILLIIKGFLLRGHFPAAGEGGGSERPSLAAVQNPVGKAEEFWF